MLLSNGKPLSAGLVKFVSADGTLPEVSGEIQPDGGFAITTRNPGDGAAPGKYKVRIEPVGRKDPRKSRLSFPAKYVDEDSSGLAGHRPGRGQPARPVHPQVNNELPRIEDFLDLKKELRMQRPAEG